MAAGAAAWCANSLTREEKRDGFELLFDGKSMRRWHSSARKAESGAWRVKDGVLTFDKGEGLLITDDSYQEFVLRLELRGGAGVQVHNGFDVAIPSGPEWSEVEIAVVKRKLTASVKGQTLVDLTLDEKHAAGPIALKAQAAGAPAEFRNIRIQILRVGPLFGPKPKDED